MNTQKNEGLSGQEIDFGQSVKQSRLLTRIRIMMLYIFFFILLLTGYTLFYIATGRNHIAIVNGSLAFMLLVSISIFLLTANFNATTVITLFTVTLYFIYLQFDLRASTFGIVWIFIYPAIVFFMTSRTWGIFLISMFIFTLVTISLVGNFLDWPIIIPPRGLPSTILVLAITTVSFFLYAKSTMKMQDKLQDQLYRDFQTGLPNRIKLIQVIDESENPSLILVDIDRFKEVNNLFGQSFGDLVLVAVSKILNDSIRTRNFTLYKMNGDQFGLFTDGLVSKFSLLQFAREIHNRISSNLMEIKDQELHLDVTMGIASNKHQLIERTDMALKSAKSRKKMCLFYDHSLLLVEQYKNNQQYNFTIKRAIDTDNILVYYQPIMTISTKSIHHYECLLRLKKSDGTLLLPDQFMDVAKKSKLYPLLTRKVIETAFEKFSKNYYSFSINISILDIKDPVILQIIKDNMSRMQNPERVCFEILESEGFENFEEVSSFVEIIKQLGGSVAIDDFGSGYSNFENLLKLRIDYLKIDGTLIKEIDKDPTRQIIVKHIINFARDLKIKTVAEYVDSRKLADIVETMRVDYIQGFFIGMPDQDIS
jgi:diguanylate cyclase (GGDEF)-like protein